MNDRLEIIAKFRAILNSIIIFSILVSIGIILDIIKYIPQYFFPSYPYNIYILILLSLLTVFFYSKYRKSKFIEWLIGSSASIIAIILLFSIIIFSGILKNYPNYFKIPLITNSSQLLASWTFLFIKLYLYICLCYVLLKRLFPIVLKNIGFLLTHLGILLVLTGITFGISDIQTVTINLLENGERNNIGVTTNKQLKNLPFDLQLLEFTLVTPSNFWSKLIISQDSINNDTITLGKSKPYHYKGWKLFQAGYDISKGKLSSLSMIKAEYNPWQKIIYIGLILLFLGSLILIRTRTKNPKSIFLHYLIFVLYLCFFLLTLSIILSYILFNEATGVFLIWNLSNVWLHATWLFLFLIIHFNFYFRYKTNILR